MRSFLCLSQLVKGGVSAGLVSWVQTVILPDNATARVAATAATAGDITPVGRRLQAERKAEGAEAAAAVGVASGVSPARRWLQAERKPEAAEAVMEFADFDEALSREGRRLQASRHSCSQ